MSKLKLKYPNSRRSSPSDESDQDHDGFNFDSEDQDEEEDDDDVIRCVCRSSDDDGFSIQCEVCETWQHGRCVKITRKSVPKHYICKFCLNSKISTKDDRSLSPQNRRKVTNENMKNKKKTVNTSKSQRPTTTTKKRVHYDNQDSSSDNSSDDEQLQQQLVRNSKKKFQRISKNIMKEKIVEDLYVEIRRQWMELYIQSGKKLISPGSSNSKGLDSIIGMETNLLLPDIPKHKVLPIRKSLRANYSALNKDPSIQHGVFADQGMPKDRFVLEVIGEASKIKDNTSSSLGTPPAHVFYYPNLDLCLDTRHVGNDARYIRRSCRPNSELKSIILKNNEKDQMVHLGVYTKKAVDRQDEITIGWNWTNGHVMWKKNKEFKTKDYSPLVMNATQRKSLQQTLNLLHTEFGECACEDEDDCLFVYLKDELERSEEDEDEDSVGSPSSVTNANKRKRPGASNSKPRNKPSLATAAKVMFTSDEDEEDQLSKSKKTRLNTAKKQLKLKGKETSLSAVSINGSVDVDITTISPAPVSQPSSENEFESVGKKIIRLISPDKSSIQNLPAKKRWLKLYLEEMATTPENNIPDDKLTTPKIQASPIKSPQGIAEELVFDEGELSDGGSSQSTLPLDDTSLVRLQDTVVSVEEKREVAAGDSKRENDTTSMAVDESLTETKVTIKDEEIKVAESSSTSEPQQQTSSTADTTSSTATDEVPAEVKTCEPQAPKVRISLQEYLQRQQGN